MRQEGVVLAQDERSGSAKHKKCCGGESMIAVALKALWGVRGGRLVAPRADGGGERERREARERRPKRGEGQISADLRSYPCGAAPRTLRGRRVSESGLHGSLVSIGPCHNRR